MNQLLEMAKSFFGVRLSITLLCAIDRALVDASRVIATLRTVLTWIASITLQFPTSALLACSPLQSIPDGGGKPAFGAREGLAVPSDTLLWWAHCSSGMLMTLF